MLDENKPTLYLIRGIPGSGKSTFGNQLALFNIVLVSLETDKLFMNTNNEYEFDSSKLGEYHARIQEITANYLKRGISIAVSNTSTTEKEVNTYKDIADSVGANFFSIIVENRHGNSNLHSVPDTVIQNMKSRFSIKL